MPWTKSRVLYIGRYADNDIISPAGAPLRAIESSLRWRKFAACLEASANFHYFSVDRLLNRMAVDFHLRHQRRCQRLFHWTKTWRDFSFFQWKRLSISIWLSLYRECVNKLCGGDFYHRFNRCQKKTILKFISIFQFILHVFHIFLQKILVYISRNMRQKSRVK